MAETGRRSEAPDAELSTSPRPRTVAATPEEARLTIRVVEGADRGVTLTLGRGPRLVGTSPSCDLRLTDRQVSRRHARLEAEGQRVRVEDLDSTNQSFINAVAVLEGYAVPDDLIRLGSTTLRVERDQAGPVEPIAVTSGFGRLVGASPQMRRLYPLCERLATSTLPVIIEGETGTGKEILAESLHEQGPRAMGPFVVFDCTAVPPSLLEAELFGHERGAFTGATLTRAGVFEQAQGGTLLIDEIGDLDLALQPKLLRAIDRSEVRRIGSDRTIRVDVRLLCATRRDLDREVQRGRFRDDLFHRIAVARIELPPLRRRVGDVALLAGRFCRELGGNEHAVFADLVTKWELYSWPGNVRELRNAVARWVALGEPGSHSERAPARGGEREEKASAGIQTDLDRVLAMDLPLIQARRRVVEEFERRYIERVLAQHGGHVARAAAASGIARRHFHRLRARTR